MKILAFGEILWDVYSDEKYIGGASLNFAAHLAQHNEEAYMLSCLGKDQLGEEALSYLHSCGLLADYVSRSDEKQTGRCLVTLDENAVPSYDLLNDVAYDYIDCDAVKEDFDVLYFGTLALRGEYNLNSLDKLLKRQKFREIFVDVNIRAPFYRRESVAFAVSNATILKISSEELPVVAELLSIDGFADYKEFAKLLSRRYSNLKILLITLGADGAYCYDCKDGTECSGQSVKVEVASTVGAGDSFSAAFLHQYLREKELQFCLDYASRVAGFVVSKVDAVPKYTVEDFA